MYWFISNTVSITVVILFISIVIYQFIYWKDPIIPLTSDLAICHEDIIRKETICLPSCNHGYFSIPNMKECVPWIGCADIDNMPRFEMLGQGAVKTVNRGTWYGYNVAVNTLRNDDLKEDFLHGLNMLRQFQPHAEVVKLIGWCDHVYVTEYHPLGSAENLNSVLEQYATHNTILKRFRACVSYLKAISFLHSSPLGTRVMCDSNDPDKTLSQFLITSDLDLVLNDLDALPEVNSDLEVKCKCGHRELFGDFVAPEQLWPFEDAEFDDELMPSYDEKTDIWKIPDVCGRILGDRRDLLLLHLMEIHASCKQDNPSLRPTVEDVLLVYTNILQKLIKQ